MRTFCFALRIEAFNFGPPSAKPQAPGRLLQRTRNTPGMVMWLQRAAMPLRQQQPPHDTPGPPLLQRNALSAHPPNRLQSTPVSSHHSKTASHPGDVSSEQQSSGSSGELFQVRALHTRPQPV